MNDQKKADNILQFPTGKRKATEGTVTTPPAAPTPDSKKPTAGKKKKAVTAGTVLAIILATAAVNRFTYSQVESQTSASHLGRSIASVQPMNYQRDADWEKKMAESLASAKPRGVASVGLGRAATKEEKLRWGILEQKYTIVFNSDLHEIDSIMLQDSSTNPSYILDRRKFLSEYGSLFDQNFSKAELKSVKTAEDKTIESYTLFDKDQRPTGEARFELDIHKRLISLKVAPVQI